MFLVLLMTGRAVVAALTGLLNFLLRKVQFGAGDAHRQHHLFFGALAFRLRGDFCLPPEFLLMFAVTHHAEKRGEQNHGQRARRRHGCG